MKKELTKTLSNGQKIEIMFGYTDRNCDECYSNFKDASYMNFDRGCTYAAFVRVIKVDTYTSYVVSKQTDWLTAPLTAKEKEQFKSDYLNSL